MHYYLAQNVTKVLSVFTLLSHVGLVLFALLFFLRKQTFFAPYWQKLKQAIERYGQWVAFLIPLTAVAMSLFYSEVADFAPCLLCWWQRIFIYPQVIVAAVAIKRKEMVSVFYTLPLTVIGLAIAIYHYTIQIQETYGGQFISVIECTTSGSGPACSSYYFLEFGYITIPLMSVTAFALLLIVQLFLWKKAKRSLA